jgi:hypothetical protein
VFLSLIREKEQGSYLTSLASQFQVSGWNQFFQGRAQEELGCEILDIALHGITLYWSDVRVERVEEPPWIWRCHGETLA